MIRLEITDPTTGKTYVPNLSADLSFEMIRENPLFTRRGDYTYDIDISLDDPHNRAIYQHIDRLTANSHPKNRKARLLADGHVIADGTEVVLSIQNNYAKIQILAGNSELNYITADANIRVREMDFGRIPEPTLAIAQNVANKIYPDANFAFPAVYVDKGENPYKNSTIQNINDKPVYNTEDGLWPMPYLLYYVEKFITLLGYSISETKNALRNDIRWRRLLVINAYDTREYARMLPNWSAYEFLTYIEQFFNITIVVNPITKVAEIYNLYDWYNAQSPIEVEDTSVFDLTEKNFDERENEFHHNYQCVEYESLGSSLSAIEENVKRKCETIEATPEEAADLTNTDWVIFTHPTYLFNFIRIRKNKEFENTKYNIIADQFRAAAVNEEARNNSTKLKIVPAEIRASLTTVYLPGDDPSSPITGYDHCAYPNYQDDIENKDFQTALEEGLEDHASSIMQVAFYAGFIEVRDPFNGPTAKLTGRKTTTCFAQRYYLADRYDNTHTVMTYTEDEISGFNNMTLELDGNWGRMVHDYAQNDLVDLDQQQIIKIRNLKFVGPMMKFLIHGRLFVCKQLKYTYANGHQDPIVEGIFYPYI